MATGIRALNSALTRSLRQTVKLIALLTCAVVLLGFATRVSAADTPFVFADPAQGTRYERLLAELRCLVCQNQSLADSNADLAQDLRNEIHRMLNAGENDQAIIAFLVARYGDFVLYRPPLQRTTSLLWFGPLLLLGIAALIWRRVTRAAGANPAPLNDDEHARLRALTHLKQGSE